jgi:pre-mRNA-splicing factor ATP-dependent RNA helicase DHX15/PRP43
LKVIIISGKCATPKLQKYLCNAPLFDILSHTWPVTTYYVSAPVKDYIEQAVVTVLQIHANEKPGDILLYLITDEDIKETYRKLLEHIGEGDALKIHILYASLAPAQQIVEPAPGPIYQGGPSGRNVFLALDIPETRLCHEITYVVDPGLSQQYIYNPRIRVDSLLVSPISQACAQRRAYQAGRARAGKCFRLFTESGFKGLAKESFPEVLRQSLRATLNGLKEFGIKNLVKFNLIDAPAPETMMRALEELNYLGCLNDDGEITELGKLVAKFPLDPFLALMLIKSAEYQCSNEILSLVAMLSVPNVFLPSLNRMQEGKIMRTFADPESDHLTLLNVYHAFKAGLFLPGCCLR